MSVEINIEEYVSGVDVKGLFGRFDYSLNFSSIEKIDIITAPNGYGKTTILKIVDAIVNQRHVFLFGLQFREIVLFVSGGRQIVVSRDAEDLFEENKDYGKSYRVKYEGFGVEDNVVDLSDRHWRKLSNRLERMAPVRRVAPNLWRDYPSGDTLSYEEVILRYVDTLPEELEFLPASSPEIRAALSNIRVLFVETQRLLELEYEGDRDYRRQSGPQAKSVVESDAADLSVRIKTALQDYAKESQKLDQTFPSRVLAQVPKDVGVEELNRNLSSLVERRRLLQQVGLIDDAVATPMEYPTAAESSVLRGLLSMYVSDTQKKFRVFDVLYEKISTFKRILNDRFRHKIVEVNPQEGIVVRDQDTQAKVPLAGLSSGEQHELVLLYELLFKTQPGAMILIDEPELSLHVVWQKKFLDDLRDIQRSTNLRVVVATHSPQIINDNWDLVTELTEVTL